MDQICIAKSGLRANQAETPGLNPPPKNFSKKMFFLEKIGGLPLETEH